MNMNVKSPIELCSIDDCNRATKTRGWCDAHYTKWRRYGDPLVGSTNYNNAEDRFKNRYKTNKTTGCFDWTGSISNTGYGWLIHKKRNISAHRYAWLRVHKEIPSGLHVLHKCDNLKCVNIEHLFLGTHSDNMQDMYNKGRHKSNRKLSTKDVKNIRNDKTSSTIMITEKYDIDPSYIRQIVTNKVRK